MFIVYVNATVNSAYLVAIFAGLPNIRDIFSIYSKCESCFWKHYDSVNKNLMMKDTRIASIVLGECVRLSENCCNNSTASVTFNITNSLWPLISSGIAKFLIIFEWCFTYGKKDSKIHRESRTNITLLMVNCETL